MATEIKVPDLGESVIEATVARWLKNEGDPVSAGEAVLVLETDKVDLEVAAEQDGVLAKIARQAGEDVQVGDVLGMVGEAGEKVAAPAAPAKVAAKTDSKPAAPQPLESAPRAASTAAPSTRPSSAPAPAELAPSEERITPVARRVAEENGVDIAQVAARAGGGRVTKEDVERFIAERKSVETPAPTAKAAPVVVSAPASANGYRREQRARMSRRRRTIAQRLVEAQHTAAMLTTFNEVDMTAVQEVRSRRKEAFKQKYGVSLGLSSFFVKATIGALKAFPQLNAEIQGDDIITKYYYDIGIAIGAAEGLVVPVLRDADRMSFADIEKAIKDFAQQTEDGTLSLEALRGGTFTITNGGVFGSLMSTPILNPPQVGILGLHKIEDRPVALNGQVVIRPMMYVALSYDHRIVDGREAVQFLVRMKQLIEDPESLLIEG